MNAYKESLDAMTESQRLHTLTRWNQRIQREIQVPLAKLRSDAELRGDAQARCFLTAIDDALHQFRQVHCTCRSKSD